VRSHWNPFRDGHFASSVIFEGNTQLDRGFEGRRRCYLRVRVTEIIVEVRHQLQVNKVAVYVPVHYAFGRLHLIQFAFGRLSGVRESGHVLLGVLRGGRRARTPRDLGRTKMHQQNIGSLDPVRSLGRPRARHHAASSTLALEVAPIPRTCRQTERHAPFRGILGSAFQQKPRVAPSSGLCPGSGQTDHRGT
jgi:hypothetical protein